MDQKSSGIDSSTKVAAIGGLPLSAMVIWWMETLFLKPRGLTMDPAAAAVAGGIGALILGELFKDIGQIYRVIIHKVIEKLK